MVDRPARVWERDGMILIAPPLPIRPFSAALPTHCRSARTTGLSWMVAADDADSAVALLRAHFPVVHDERPNAPPPPPFDDGAEREPFERLDLLPMLTPLAPALRASGNDYHPARAALAQLAALSPALPAQLGFAESVAERWVLATGAQHFWDALLNTFPQVVQSAVQPDGTLHEELAAAAVTAYWHHIRREVCGACPAYTGQCWYPPRTTLPLWIAGLLACLPGPAFARTAAYPTLVRQLPPWPLRVPCPLYRLDHHDATHWLLSGCVLPAAQSSDGSDTLLHLSAVNGVSKNRALWAAILDRRRVPLPLRINDQPYAPRRVAGANQYVCAWNDQPLPTSGLSHLALTHRSAFEPDLGQDFLHLVGNDAHGVPDLPLFAQQLSRAISVPFDLAWAAQLWDEGRAPDEPGQSSVAGAAPPLITPLPSMGCQGYWVLADEPRWTRLIVAVQQGVAPSSLSADDLVITAIGAAPPIAPVVEQDSAGSDDPDDADEE